MGVFASLMRASLDLLLPRSAVQKQIDGLGSASLGERLLIQKPFPEEDITALFPYRDPLIREMIWQLKYRKNEHVARLFASALHDFLLETYAEDLPFSGAAPLVLIPVPLARRRLRARGYNQIELVTNHFPKAPWVHVAPEILARTRDTKPQTALSKAQRLKNLEGAFAALQEGETLHAPLVLLDDVTTTGSTLREARKTLLAAGAREVSCIALAH